MIYNKLNKVVLGIFATFLMLMGSCGEENETTDSDEIVDPIIEEYGLILNDFEVVRDTVMTGDTFGGILSNHGVSQAKIYEVATTFREVFDVRKIGVGQIGRAHV